MTATSQSTSTSPWITVTQGMSGWFAVQLMWNPDMGGWEPWNTGPGRYADRADAEREAREWAEAEEMEFRS